MSGIVPMWKPLWKIWFELCFAQNTPNWDVPVIRKRETRQSLESFIRPGKLAGRALVYNCDTSVVYLHTLSALNLALPLYLHNPIGIPHWIICGHVFCYSTPASEIAGDLGEVSGGHASSGSRLAGIRFDCDLIDSLSLILWDTVINSLWNKIIAHMFPVSGRLLDFFRYRRGKFLKPTSRRFQILKSLLWKWFFSLLSSQPSRRPAWDSAIVRLPQWRRRSRPCLQCRPRMPPVRSSEELVRGPERCSNLVESAPDRMTALWKRC